MTIMMITIMIMIIVIVIIIVILISRIQAIIIIIIMMIILTNTKHPNNTAMHTTNNSSTNTDTKRSAPRGPAQRGRPCSAASWAPATAIRDFKDTAYPFFESDALFLECAVWIVVSCLAILPSRGNHLSSASCPMHVLFKSG